MHGATEQTSTRLAWIDFAKGLAIILIVMHHMRDYALVLVPPDPSQIFRWSYIDPLLLYIRLPLFFVVSGVLASRHLAGGQLGRGVRKAAELALVYVGWAVLMAMLVPNWPNDGWRWAIDATTLKDLLRGDSVLWYLWAIILAFAFAAATRSLPPLMACILACLIGILFERHVIEFGGSFGLFSRYLPLYCVGARYPALMIRMARCRSRSAVAILIVTYAVLLPVESGGVLFDLVRSLCGVSLALIGAGWAVDRLPLVTSRICWLGRRTLPIYIFHFPIAVAIGCTALRHGVPPSLQTTAMMIFLPVATALPIILSLALFTMMSRLGIAWTLAMPGKAKRETTHASPDSVDRKSYSDECLTGLQPVSRAMATQ